MEHTVCYRIPLKFSNEEHPLSSRTEGMSEALS